MDETAFKQQLEQDGYEDIGVIEWESAKTTGLHTHDFAARGLVLAGTVTVTTDSDTMACRPGDIFAVALETPHIETVGSEGARVLIGRKR